MLTFLKKHSILLTPSAVAESAVKKIKGVAAGACRGIAAPVEPRHHLMRTVLMLIGLVILFENIFLFFTSALPRSSPPRSQRPPAHASVVGSDPLKLDPAFQNMLRQMVHDEILKEKQRQSLPLTATMHPLVFATLPPPVQPSIGSNTHSNANSLQQQDQSLSLQSSQNMHPFTHSVVGSSTYSNTNALQHQDLTLSLQSSKNMRPFAHSIVGSDSYFSANAVQQHVVGSKHTDFQANSLRASQLLTEAVGAELKHPSVGTAAQDLGPDLVLGMASNIHDMNLAVFVKSLREYNKKCLIVIILDENTYMHRSPRAKELCEKYQVTALPLGLSTLQPEAMRKYHPSTFRWPLLHAFLDAPLERKDPLFGPQITAQSFSKVLLADVRDTAFSGDPFPIVSTTNGLYAFGEDTLIANEGWNSGWIKDCWGQDILQQVEQKEVMCSGIVMGTTASISAYLLAMTNKIMSADFATCERNGVDQGMHNVIVHTKMAPNVIFHRQSSGVVAHMQAKIMQHVMGSTEVQNYAGQNAIIVHQYDRDKELSKELFSKWVDWVSAYKVRGEDLCSTYQLLQNGELFDKVGDFEDSSVFEISSVQECCNECNKRPNVCTSFTHVGHVCWLKSLNQRFELQQEIQKEATIVPDVTSGWLVGQGTATATATGTATAMASHMLPYQRVPPQVNRLNPQQQANVPLHKPYVPTYGQGNIQQHVNLPMQKPFVPAHGHESPQQQVNLPYVPAYVHGNSQQQAHLRTQKPYGEANHQEQPDVTLRKPNVPVYVQGIYKQQLDFSLRKPNVPVYVHRISQQQADIQVDLQEQLNFTLQKPYIPTYVQANPQQQAHLRIQNPAVQGDLQEELNYTWSKPYISAYVAHSQPNAVHVKPDAYRELARNDTAIWHKKQFVESFNRTESEQSQHSYSERANEILRNSLRPNQGPAGVVAHV